MNLEELYTTWRGRVYGFFLRKGIPVDEAEDMVQEVFLRMIRSYKPLPGTGPNTWLYRTITNLCIDRGRRERRGLVELTRSNSPAYEPDPSVPLLVEDMLRTLTERQRQVVALSAAGYQQADIARFTNSTVEGVKKIRQRAHHAMRTEYAA